MNRSGYKQHNQYNQVQIKTANKGKLIVMLYQGAIRFMNRALLLIEKKDMEGKGNSLIRAQDIILELLYSLDQSLLDQGDELASPIFSQTELNMSQFFEVKPSVLQHFPLIQ